MTKTNSWKEDKGIYFGIKLIELFHYAFGSGLYVCGKYLRDRADLEKKL